MNRIKYTPDVKAKYVAGLGPTFGELFVLLLEEVVFLNNKWLQYRAIYAKSPERIDLLNKTAGFFFSVLNFILWEDILLGIARLTDPQKSLGRRPNLTIQAIPDVIDDLDFRGKLQPLILRALEQCDFARDWRNRHLAHRDLDLIKETAEPLAELTRAKTQAAIDSIIDIIQLIEAHYFNAESTFEILAAGDADAMIYYLNAGKFYSDLQTKRLKSGEEFERPPHV